MNMVYKVGQYFAAPWCSSHVKNIDLWNTRYPKYPMILKTNRVRIGYWKKLRVRVGYRVPVGHCMYDTYIYDPRSWGMHAWCSYEWCIYQWSFILIHVSMMRDFFRTNGRTNEQGDSRSWKSHLWATYFSGPWCSAVPSQVPQPTCFWKLVGRTNP